MARTEGAAFRDTIPAAVTNRSGQNPSGRTHGGRETDYAALLRAAQGGNHAALERLLMKSQEIAYRFSLLVCGHADDADDAMQEALLKTYRHAAQIKEPEAFKTWLYRTVKNACLISRRRRVGEPSRLHSLDGESVSIDGVAQPLDVEDPGRGPYQALENTRLRRALDRALQTLSPENRLIVFLREVEGLSTRDVAAVVGISEANVKTRLHRARLSLREHLEAP